MIAWFINDSEWRYTVITIVICIAINLTLPIWLFLAKIRDGRRSPGGKEETLNDSDADSESQDENTKGSGKNYPMSVISDAQHSIASSAIGSQISAVLEARPRRAGLHKGDRRRRKRERDIRSAAGMQTRKLDGTLEQMELSLPNGNFTGEKSVMSKLSVDDISMNDGVDGKDKVETTFHGMGAPYESRRCSQVVLEATEWDSSLMSLAGFYMIQALTEKITDLIELSVISHFIGSTEATAFVMVSFLLEITGIFVVGFQEAIGVLAPQADGSGNDLMVGRYLQIGIIFSIIFQLPGFLLWSFYMYDTIIWFGFDEPTAIIAQYYTYSVLLSVLADDINECFLTFFDVVDREKYATAYAVISSFASTGVVVAMACFGESNMFVIGLAQSLVDLTLLFVNIVFVVNRGWLDDYSEGLVKSFGLKDRGAMWTTFVTAFPLAVAWLLSIGEYQVMIIFARSIGPDEVAAWNMLGYIWELFEALTEAISGAAEVRVGFRMGAGKPQQAKKMSEKSVYVGTQLAIMTAGALFVLSQFLLSWITPNLIHQKLMFDQIPLIGFGGILMVPGLVIEGILCAQGRVRLMTTIEIIVSWFIAIPVAAILVYYFYSSLEGIVSGLVLGYSTGATILLFFFLRSDWEQLSQKIMERNAAEGLQYLDTEWDDLPNEVQKAASTLGYTRDMWESHGEPDSNNKSWNDLTQAERNAAGILGYNKKKWNGETDSTEGPGQYEEYDFDELPTKVKEAAIILGFNRSIWDKDGSIPIESKDWSDLTAVQRNAATTLGYTKEKWDNGSDSSSSSSSDANVQPVVAMPAIPEDESVDAAAPTTENEEVVDYEDYDFDELPLHAMNAAKLLGYTCAIWDYGGSIPIENKDWADLTGAEQNAASVLGYTRKKWDEDSSSSESEKNSESRRKSESMTINMSDLSANCDQLCSSEGESNTFANFDTSICTSASDDGSAPWDEPPIPDSQILGSDLKALVKRRTMIEKRNNQDSQFSVTKYGDYRFDELSSDLQQAALILGFTKSTWDRNLFIPKKSKTWDSLTPQEMAAARSLGCTEEKWEKLLDSW